ncbi:MAG: sulfotransferase [Dermatophilaceae bacterium]
MSDTEKPAETSALAYTASRVARHLHWARTEGIRRLIEEDRLDPRDRLRTAAAKWLWRRRRGVKPGSAVAVYVVGLQRSGTNMLMRGLDAAPEVEVRNENDRRLFHRFRMRSDDVLRQTVARSRHAFVLVKPLCDTHRIDELLDLPGLAPGRAVWMFRDVDDRARSEVSKFGESNLLALRRIADGTSGMDWQGQRLSDPLRELISGFDYGQMTPYSAAALFWYVRNSLYFDLGLDARDDVLLASYDELVSDPEGSMRRVCDFVGLPYRAELSDLVERRIAHQRPPLDIDPKVRSRCNAMAAQLESALHPASGATADHDTRKGPGR